MLNIPVDLGENSYDIHVGQGLLPRIFEFIPEEKLEGRRCFILTDRNLEKTFAITLFQTLVGRFGEDRVEMMAVPAGEQSKSIAELERVWKWLLNKRVNRKSIIFTVGGGVVGDLGGFAASTILRGVPFVQIPTSLLAQVDSSVGGKTGINMPQGKNLVGSFYQPMAVLCDLDVLRTLPKRQLLSGYAEIVKYALLGDPSFFIWLETHGEQVLALEPDKLGHAIEISCRKKAEIVEQDERESGVRALLNLGHTFGHALERATEYDQRLFHGEAVAIGMIMAFHLSVRMGICDSRDMERVIKHFRIVGLPVAITDINPPIEGQAETFLDYMRNDKKATDAGLNLILLNGIGRAHIVENIPEEDIKQVIELSLAGK